MLTENDGTAAAIALLGDGAVVLPVQYHDRQATRLRPEMRLMLAVLEEAVATLVRYRHARRARHQRVFREVQAWIASDDIVLPFAFVRICDAIGLDAAYLRGGLARIGRPGPATPSLRGPFRRTAGARHAIGTR